MKKSLLYLFSVLCVLCVLASCKDDEAPILPPTIEDVIATYTGDSLKVTVDGKAVAANAKVIVSKISDESELISVKLVNIIENVETIEIPDAKFEVGTKSAYFSKISGSVNEYVLGVTFVTEATIDEGLMTMVVKTAIIEGQDTNVSSLYGRVYKGKMNIDVEDVPTPETDQVIYIQSPSKADTSTFKLHIKNFYFADIKVGNITLDAIPVSQRGNVYVFKAINQEIELKTIGKKAKVDIDGLIVDGKVKLELIVNVIETSKKVNVAFEGNVKDAEIEKMTINSDLIIDEPFIKYGETNVKFRVSDVLTAEQLTFTPVIEITNGATVEVKAFEGTKSTVIEKNTPVDFSKVTRVTYKVVSEEEVKTKTFILTMEKVSIVSNTKYSFDEWEIVPSISTDVDVSFNTPKPINVLSSSNPGAQYLIAFGFNGGFPVLKATDKNDVKAGSAAVKLVTLNTIGAGFGMAPAVTSGSLFMGDFVLDMLNQLNSTKFGLPFAKKPLIFRGFYKFYPGEKYIDGSNKDKIVEVPGKKDECSIAAVLYEVDNYGEVLTGLDINTSNKRVAIANLVDGTAKSEYTEFNIPFTWLSGKTYDANKKYKLTFICSSSKEGDAFKGAPGSTLFVDELEIVSE